MLLSCIIYGFHFKIEKKLMQIYVRKTEHWVRRQCKPQLWRQGDKPKDVAKKNFFKDSVVKIEDFIE